MTQTSKRIHDDRPHIAPEDKAHRPESPSRFGDRRFWIGAGLTLLLLAFGVVTATVLLKTAPKAIPQPPERQPHSVDVAPIRATTSNIEIHAMGLVKPAQEIHLQAQISGEVIGLSRNMQPGSPVKKGELLVELDPEDYLLIVQQREASVAQAEADLTLEQGNQLVAQKEYELLNRSVRPLEEDLILRQPQLAQLKAALASAKAERSKARLDVKRTRLTAPFNAQVMEKSVDIGSLVTSNSTLATLVGTDSYWLEISVPASQIRWIQVPSTLTQEGAEVKIYQPEVWGKDVYRTGQVIRLLPDVEDTGRMARLLVNIPDPLSLTPRYQNSPPLLLNSFVQARIDGLSLSSVIEIPREMVHEGQTVWLMNDKNRLEVRPVEVAFRGRDSLIISQGLVPGDRLITSRLAAPVPGMQLIATPEGKGVEP